jgi:hypothetical protein
VIETTVSELATELRRAGVPRRLARRFEHEARDHLLSAAEARGTEAAIAAFGQPSVLARRISEQVATRSTRRAAVVALVALAGTAAAYLGAGAIASQAGNPDFTSGATPWLGVLSVLALAILPQIALACGLLVVLPLLVRRRSPVLSDAELTVVRRRAAVAVAAGAGAMVAWALWLLEFRSQITEAASWAVPVLVALVLVSLLPLSLASVSVKRASRPAAWQGPRATTALEDAVALGAAVLPASRRFVSLSPWRLAAALAGLIGAVAFAAGWALEGDPGSGVVRGGFEAVAVLACFAGLRRALLLAGGE